MMDGDKPAMGARSDLRRAQIAAAARDVLIEHGYAGLTARKVAGAAGISLGHLTYHYQTMDAVLAAAYDLVARQLALPAAPPPAGLTPSERLERYLRSVYAPEHLGADQLRLRVDLWSAARVHPQIAEIERALHEANRAVIEGLLTAISDPWKTARIPMVEAFVLATMDGLWLEYMRSRDLDAVRAAIEACVLFAKMRLGGS